MKQEVHLLQNAVNEIKFLRSQNQVMKARLDMFDDCMKLFSSMQPQRGMMSSPDIVFEIERLVERESNGQDMPKEVDLKQQRETH
jgi:hypothetical protein